jgi:hypothetical protein
MNALFNKYVNGHTIGELPKREEVPNPERLMALGYVNTAEGWVHSTQAVLLPQGGKLVWAKL